MRTVTPDELVRAAIDVAEEGMAHGERPIGAVVEIGGQIIARAYTRNRSWGRHLAHADLLATAWESGFRSWARTLR